MAVTLIFTFTACGSDSGDGTDSGESAAWSIEGYFADENENMLSVTYMEDIDEPGWYVGAMLGEDPMEDSYGGTLTEEAGALKGSLPSSGSKDPIEVTVNAEGENGLMLEVAGGETYHFTPMDLPDASIIVTINTEGMGNIEYTEGEETPEVDKEYPYQSAQINLAEPKTHTFLAWPQEGNKFVKWTKNGEDFSTDAQITVLLDESADFIAVFEADEDYQDPIEAVAGEYQCDRANATIMSDGFGTALINIDWGSSASSIGRWTMSGKMDAETKTITYSDCTMAEVTYADNGDVEEEVVDHENGTGTIVFNEDGTFTWNDDQSEYEDLVFVKLEEPEEEGE